MLVSLLIVLGAAILLRGGYLIYKDFAKAKPQRDARRMEMKKAMEKAKNQNMEKIPIQEKEGKKEEVKLNSKKEDKTVNKVR